MKIKDFPSLPLGWGNSLFFTKGTSDSREKRGTLPPPLFWNVCHRESRVPSGVQACPAFCCTPPGPQLREGPTTVSGEREVPAQELKPSTTSQIQEGWVSSRLAVGLSSLNMGGSLSLPAPSMDLVSKVGSILNPPEEHKQRAPKSLSWIQPQNLLFQLRRQPLLFTGGSGSKTELVHYPKINPSSSMPMFSFHCSFT